LSTGIDKPDYRYLAKLAGVSIILQILGWSVSTFPFFYFFSLVPIIALTRYVLTRKEFSFLDYFMSVFFCFIIPAFAKLIFFPPSFRSFAANMGPFIAFLLWYLSARTVGNLRNVYLVIFWLGIEYISIAIKPPVFNHLPGAVFRLWGESLVWIRYTGFQGTTLWILLVNILFGNAILQPDGKPFGGVHRYKFLLAAIVGVLPMIVSMFAYQGNPPADLTPFFKNPAAYQLNFNFAPFYSYYLDYGEYIGKTCFWLTLLTLLS